MMKTYCWIVLLAASLIMSACSLSERSFCSGDEDCLDCEACIEECLAMVRARLAGAAGGNKDTSDEQAD